MILWDTIRWITAVASLVVTGSAPFVLVYQMAWHQRARVIGASVMCGVIVSSQFANLGTYPASAWRTSLLCIGSAIFALGMVYFVRHLWRTDDA